jgi:flagellar export protein FliJ
MAVPRTRLDPLVGIRKRTEETALTVLATARRALGTAQEKLAGAIAQARVDYRDQDDSAFWIVEEAAHRRALQVASSARLDVSRAAAGEAAAQAGYGEARKQAEVVRRVADRKRADYLKGLAKLELRRFDEMGAVAFQRARASGD